MKKEIDMINKNETWELVSKPADGHVIGINWVFRTKFNYWWFYIQVQSKIVVKGYAQLLGVDYGDTFAPVARHDTIKFLVALAAKLNWKLYHLDVKSAFLNGILQDEIFIEQPQGFIINGKADMVCKWEKTSYGLKPAPQTWYTRINSHLVNLGLMRSETKATLSVKGYECDQQLVVSVYVDDLLITGGNSQLVQQFKQLMMDEFAMVDLWEMSYFLGMEVEQSDDSIFLSQKKYARDILQKFQLEKCKEVIVLLVVWRRQNWWNKF